MSVPEQTPQRVRQNHVTQVQQRLSHRDWKIIETLSSLRLASGHQLETLCFQDHLDGHSRTVVRGRVLSRLIRWRVLQRLDRRVGGSGGGSSSWIFGLDTAGSALARQRALADNLPNRRYGLPGDRFVAHTLAVAQVRADLGRAADATIRVETFDTEPSSWWPDGLGSHIKPDAYTAIITADVRDHWWIEVDLATESLPTIRRKVQRYVDFARRGQVGPSGVVPRVLFSVRGEGRRDAISQLVNSMPEPAGQMVHTCVDTDTALALLGRLLE
jgi:hypothetical protein